MRKQSLFFLLGFFILQWRPSDGIDCYQQAATSVTYGTAYNVFTCPGNVNQCYKYVCVGSAYYVQKGCLDPQSPTQNCQVIQGQCQSQGGTGACYVCSGNRCNAAPPTAAHPWPLNTLLLASIAFILIPSFFQTNL